MLEFLQTQLFFLEQLANRVVSTQLTHLSLVSLGIIFLAGLVPA